ncbi:phage tail-collar fiber domain-containing protein [Pseudomonas sp. 24 R 17]|uniref:phage tail-collar fiber domain-containing protein n=1 Tax=Pseudomonas sp. 24 R 17 TaxID=1844096 RepID=UPI0008126615|nr:phage tail protein [Pseudomonas sp. 24 R 17]CRM18800.1 long tail fiber, proximal subunit [Pseudomonas sp. 24 R 17]CRM46673.1 long tail fiber, proximal subunit [Pseudomonas sp. 24 R 17]
MTDQNSQFFAILTAVGEAKQANAAALGTSWTFAQMAVGDANGTDPIPSRTQTKLINERRRAPLNQVKVDPANASVIIAEQIIPESVGGWWVRELALYDADGDMVAVANCAPTFKPLLTQGSGRTQVIRINLIVSSTANIELKIDPSVVLATREYVDTVIVEALSKLDYKHSVLAATTANITLSGIQTIDGELLPAGARVLVKDQAQAKENGIYVVPAAGVWKRAQDADTSVEVTPGLFVSVEKGTVNGDSVWQLVTDAPIVLGTTALAFEMVAGRTGVSAGAYTKVTVDKYGRVIAGTTPTTLAGHGITDTYTKDEIAAMIAQASALPVGSMIGFPVDKVAPGFLELDGSVKSTAAYPDLATFLGGAFNKGDEGAGNFRLPESRGEFLRGWDHGRGVDAGRVIGSWQKGTVQSFDIGPSNGVCGPRSGVLPATGDNGRADLGYDATQAALYPSAAVAVGNAGTVSGLADNGEISYGATRPRNLAVMWCVKAWNAPINQGNIDIAALATLAAQATETNQGTAKVATQAQVDQGLDDATIVTPKKLRAGFKVSLGVNGYIYFPSWMGGLVWQWGNRSFTSGTSVPFAIPFPVECLIAWAVPNSIVGGSPSTVAANVQSLTTNSMILSWTAGGTYSFFWFALGR